MALAIERQDVDRSGVGRQDVEEVVIREGCNGVVDCGRSRCEGILLDDLAREVIGDGDLGDDVCPDVGEEEGSGFLRKTRPAGRALARNGEDLAVRRAPGSERAEVECGEANARIGGEHRVLSGDDGHREGEEAALCWRVGGEVGREGAVIRNVPTSDEPWSRRNALDGDEQLL